MKLLLQSSQNKRAVAYYRHSDRDKQEYSIPIQRQHAQKFAKQYGIDIIHEEEDRQTGLLADRPGFSGLFNDWIFNKKAPHFDCVLVYDVSRWGRFQDQDEAAYYEFRCKKHGKRVIYVDRGFPKEEQQLISHLQTSIERYMAAEYSRQLSHKVFHGCAQVSREGYSAGGMACYGMGRLLLDVNKNPIRILERGEHKQIANERVTFTPLDDETTQIVKDIFDMFVDDHKTPSRIAAVLNKRKIPSAAGGKWNRGKVVHVLSNATYIGTRIYNKTWNRLKQGRRDNPQSDWVICENAFKPIIAKEKFKKAQDRIKSLSTYKKNSNLYPTKRAEILINTEVRNMLSNKGVHPDLVYAFIMNSPLLTSMGITDKLNGKKYWCFVLPEHLRIFDFVVAASITTDNKSPIECFFLIPTKGFGIGGTLLFAEHNKKAQTYSLDADKIENILIDLMEQFCERSGLHAYGNKSFDKSIPIKNRNYAQQLVCTSS